MLAEWTSEILSLSMPALWSKFNKAYDIVQHHLPVEQVEVHRGVPPDAGSHQISVFWWDALHKGSWHS